MAKKTAAKKAMKAPKKPAKRSPGAADSIRKLDAEFMKAANAKNAGALVKAFYARDAVLMPPNHPAAEGAAAIQTFMQGLIDAGLTSIKLETTSVETAGDLACGRGRYMLSIVSPDGTPVQDVGKYVVTYRRQPNGAWRAVNDIFNSDQGAG